MELIKKHKFKIMILIISFFIGILSFTYGKYVSNSIWNYYLESNGFYLSSENLGDTTLKNVNNLWNGDSVFFNIKNSLNSSVATGYDINYTATCTIEGEAATKAKCNLNGSDSNVQDGVLTSIQNCENNSTDGIDVSNYNKETCELEGYKWKNETVENKLYFDIVATDPEYTLTDLVVNITLTSNSPYRKTLSGNFILHKSDITTEKISLNYKNYNNYDRLVVSNSFQSEKCIKITWDSNKLSINEDINSFSSYMSDSNGYINEIKFSINGKDSKSLMFYKKIFSQNYNVEEFSVEETSGC